MPAICEGFLFKIRKLRDSTNQRHQLIIGLFALVPSLIFWPTLGHAAYDVPDNIVNMELSSGLLDTVQSALPEREAVNEAFLNPSYSPDINVRLDSRLAVTFLDKGAGRRNSPDCFSYSGDVFSGLTFGKIDTGNSGNISLFELGGISGMEVGMIFSNASEAGGGGLTLNAAQGTTNDLTRRVATQFASTDKGGLLAGFEDLELLGPGRGRSAMLKG